MYEINDLVLPIHWCNWLGQDQDAPLLVPVHQENVNYRCTQSFLTSLTENFFL